MQDQLTIRLPRDLDEEVSRVARRLQINRSAVVRMAIQKFVEDFADQPQRPYERVKHLIGAVESGISNLGSMHRKHLLTKFNRAKRSS